MSTLAGLLGSLVAAAAAQERPEPAPFEPWWIDARERMQVRDTFGLVFVVPPAVTSSGAPAPTPGTTPTEDPRWMRRRDEASVRLHERMRALRRDEAPSKGLAWWYFTADERAVFALELHAMLLTSDPDVAELLLDTVLVCAPADVAQARTGETAVLIDAFGRRVGGIGVALDDEVAFARAVRALLHGDGRLAARERRASAARPELAARLREVGGEDGAVAKAARKALLASFDAAAPLVGAARARSSDPALDELVVAALHERRGKALTGVLPFGATWIERAGDPCPPCGMAAMPAPSREFLTFLTR